MRFVDSSCVGGLPEGTTTVGAVPNVPAGDGSATGAKVLAGVVVGLVEVVVELVAEVEVVVEVVVDGVVVVVAPVEEATVVVVVDVFDLPPEKSRAPVTITIAATTPTMMPRRMFLRRRW